MTTLLQRKKLPFASIHGYISMGCTGIRWKVYGTDWTGRRVRDRLVVAFEHLPAIASHRKNVFEPQEDVAADGTRIPTDGLKLISDTAEILGRESVKRVRLFTWAAEHKAIRGGHYGATVRAAEMLGVSPETLRKSVVSTSLEIANALNARSWKRGVAHSGHEPSPKTELLTLPEFGG